MSTYQGRIINLTIHGASHAPQIGVEVQGLPEGFAIDRDELQEFLKRRAPGQNEFSTQRKEADVPVFEAGLKGGNVIFGDTLKASILNTDIRSKDYSSLKIMPRPGHADYTAELKYRGAQDHNGGGKFSGRMTAPLCIAGGICKQILSAKGIEINAAVKSIAGITGDEEAMKQAILDARTNGDSVGGVVSAEITGMPVGIGGPLFEGIEGELAKMLYAIPAVKGVSFGAGFRAAEMLGSENNDPFALEDGRVVTKTNNAGGILGGISNGMPITMEVAFKPTPSIARKQQTVNLETMEETELEITGRHDPCIVMRALPVVEAAVAIVILDLIEADRLEKQNAAEMAEPVADGEMMTLDECRQRIDIIDSQLIDLFEQRMKVSEAVGAYKQAHNRPIYDAHRERIKLLDVSSRVAPEYKEYMVAFFSLLMQLSRARQGALLERGTSYEEVLTTALDRTPKQFPDSAKVACQGVEGAYSQIACDKLFALADIKYYGRFEDVFKAVQSGECQYGVIPVENSTAGSVNAVYDLMLEYKFKIARSTRVKIEHCLVVNPGTQLGEIKEIYSHPQAIMQSSEFLNSLTDVTVIPCENTAMAAQKVSESGRNDVAALSSVSCANLYQLDILKQDVQNEGNNYTRFICIAPELEIFPGADRTSLMLTVPHYKGSLYNFISFFFANGINMSKIESRPIPGKDFEFMFYFDLDVSVYSPKLATLLDELSANAPFFEYLGSYSEIV